MSPYRTPALVAYIPELDDMIDRRQHLEAARDALCALYDTGKASTVRKPVAADKPKRTRKRTVDPKIAERRDTVRLYLSSCANAVSVSALSEALGIGAPQVSLAIRQLLESGAIERVGRGRASRYKAVPTAEGEAAE